MIKLRTLSLNDADILDIAIIKLKTIKQEVIRTFSSGLTKG